ncbi:MAG: AAA family ATPase, partial [Candidatus Dadabacteria bacterium]|nr:AAA family ATPase [Candidatus Dadabacteria bacterium]
MNTLTLDDIKELAEKPRSCIYPIIKAKTSKRLVNIYHESKKDVLQSKNNHAGKKSKDNKLYKELPFEKIGVSERNSTLTSLAGKLRNTGLDPDMIDMIVESVNETKCEPPLEQKEVNKIVESICSYEHSDNNPLEVKKLSEIEVKPRSWILKDVIPMNYPTIIYGDGGSGKSYVSLYIAIKAARGGQTFYGRRFSKIRSNVLYLDFELDSYELKRRATHISNGLELKKLPEN